MEGHVVTCALIIRGSAVCSGLGGQQLSRNRQRPLSPGMESSWGNNRGRNET